MQATGGAAPCAPLRIVFIYLPSVWGFRSSWLHGAQKAATTPTTSRWRPGGHTGLPASAPWLCVAAFRRVCSEQRTRHSYTSRAGINCASKPLQNNDLRRPKPFSFQRRQRKTFATASFSGAPRRAVRTFSRTPQESQESTSPQAHACERAHPRARAAPVRAPWLEAELSEACSNEARGPGRVDGRRLRPMTEAHPVTRRARNRPRNRTSLLACCGASSVPTPTLVSPLFRIVRHGQRGHAGGIPMA
jgi:hypothetical protein